MEPPHSLQTPVKRLVGFIVPGQDIRTPATRHPASFREYEENTMRIRREYEANTKATRYPPPTTPLAPGFPRPFGCVAPAPYERDAPKRAGKARCKGVA